MVKQQLSPEYAKTFIDSCAFNPGGEEEKASRRILSDRPEIIVAHSVQKEIAHPNTPSDVKALANSQIYTISTSLTPGEIQARDDIHVLVQGNAKPNKHKDDADHLFELYKFGGGYFITTDTRLLSLGKTLFDRYTITTMLPTEYEQLL